MRSYILLHRVTVVQRKPGDITLGTFKSEQKPDLYFVDEIQAIQNNVASGFDAVLINGMSFLVKEKANEILEMILKSEGLN